MKMRITHVCGVLYNRPNITKGWRGQWQKVSFREVKELPWERTSSHFKLALLSRWFFLFPQVWIYIYIYVGSLQLILILLDKLFLAESVHFFSAHFSKQTLRLGWDRRLDEIATSKVTNAFSPCFFQEWVRYFTQAFHRAHLTFFCWIGSECGSQKSLLACHP